MIGAHADLMQVFETDSFIGNQSILLEVEDFFFGLGAGAFIGARPQGFGFWGNHVNVNFAPGSYIRNSFIDHNAVGTAMQGGLGTNVQINKLCLVGSGYSGLHGYDTFTPTLKLANGANISNSLATAIAGTGAIGANVSIIGTGATGKYPNFFPNFNANHGATIEETLHRYTPAAAHLAKSPINAKEANSSRGTAQCCGRPPVARPPARDPFWSARSRTRRLSKGPGDGSSISRRCSPERGPIASAGLPASG